MTQPCQHNHLVRDENMPKGYSCADCGALFEVEQYTPDAPVMGVPV